MADKTHIQWTDATVNFWWGCTKVGPGCDNCYAEAHDARFGGGHWGTSSPRKKIKTAVSLIHRIDNDYSEWAADFHCGLVLSPNRRVFIQSMSDLFDLEVDVNWFAEAWGRIEVCNRIDIQIVTKRVTAVAKRLAEIGRTTWPKHAGLIVTITDQAEADRDVPRLIALKEALGIPWIGLSIEPMLGPIDLTKWLHAIDWVICGGESGTKARPMHPDWARSLRDQCEASGVAFFFKQWGEWRPISQMAEAETKSCYRSRVAAKPGQDQDALDDAYGRRCLVKTRAISVQGKTVAVDAPEAFHQAHGTRWMMTFALGKKAAGDLLDGAQHHNWPQVRL